MIKEWFATKYRIMPVYDDSSNAQKAVVVEVKYNFMQEFHPMAKTCLNANGELIDKPAVFDNEKDAQNFIKHLTETL